MRERVRYPTAAAFWNTVDAKRGCTVTAPCIVSLHHDIRRASSSDRSAAARGGRQRDRATVARGVARAAGADEPDVPRDRPGPDDEGAVGGDVVARHAAAVSGAEAEDRERARRAGGDHAR